MFPSSFVLVDRKLQSTLSCGRMSQNWMSNTLYTAELNLGKIRSVFNPINPGGGYFAPPQMENCAKHSLALTSGCSDFLTFPKYVLGPC